MILTFIICTISPPRKKAAYLLKKLKEHRKERVERIEVFLLDLRI